MSQTSKSSEKRESDPAKRGKHVAGKKPEAGATVPFVAPIPPAKKEDADDEASEKAKDTDAAVDSQPTVALSATDSKDAKGEASEEDASSNAADEAQATVALSGVPEVVSAQQDEFAEDDDSASVPLPDPNAPGYVSAGIALPQEKRRRGLKAFGITVGVIAAVLLVVYLAGAVAFMGRFLPNTTIGEHDVSLKSDAEALAELDEIVADYQLDVIGGGFSYRTTGADIGLSIDSEGIVSAIHERQNAWSWPVLIIQSSHDEADLLKVSFRESAYADSVNEAIRVFNEGATAPVNATIAYDEKTSKFVVKPEIEGTQFDAAAVLAVMAEAIERLDYKALLTDEQHIKPTVFSDDPKLIEAAELATGMVSADLTLFMGGQDVGRVNGDSLSNFITIDDNFQVTFREDELNSWVNTLAANYDTVGTERTFTRADGKQIVVPAGGSYGWEIDTEALKTAILEGIKAGAITQIEVPCIETAAVYKGVGERDWGNRYIDVDISEQYVRFYGDDGAIIWEAPCISGAPDGEHDTGTGTWYVNAKESPSKLIGYENGKKIYETTVTYWMPFEGNGIGFHDATWQPSFGGTMYANGYGSHGCVNLSYSAAQELYSIIQYGDPVVVHY